ncbi:hypothetical protein EVAR_95195_1 [Eumeta japonica]|uniref:Uncharacterized protein n=1 Tax=Eumeta variegata TaxID=151549 RepID=A0A4C1VHL5_EUMVA|nr:hypothetical protein EVAR_95195_1 [Eumeta japonica]
MFRELIYMANTANARRADGRGRRVGDGRPQISAEHRFILLSLLQYSRANEQTSQIEQKVDGHRRPWTLITPEESLAHRRSLE